jgi:hypothetical protein
MILAEKPATPRRRLRGFETFSDLILGSRAQHGVSKDGRESVPCNILRDAGFAGSSG